MKRITGIRFAAWLLACLPFASIAQGGDAQPLCPDGLPSCVVSNWGAIEPDGVDTQGVGAIAPHNVDARRDRIAMAIKPVPVADGRPAADASSVKALVSPQALFPKETAALVSAIDRARFHRDGTVASGGDRIAAAAAAVARQAGNRYVLTLYIKVPQRLGPDATGALNKKVASVNDLLGGWDRASKASKQ